MAKKPPVPPTVTAHRGDAKTLLAFNLPDRDRAANLAGFTVQCQPPGQDPFYIQNRLQFKVPADHAQDPKEPAVSSINAPIHKFRWLHIPGSIHQGIAPVLGKYKYTVTPRFFDDNGSMLPLDPKLSATESVDVQPFRKGNLRLGFTRGFTQSQAFVHHFGLKASIRPKGTDLLFDTTQRSGTNAQGETYTFRDEYQWLGFTARQRILEVLDAVVKDKKLELDVFAYDLNEPDFCSQFLKLAGQGRIRVILDNAALHHGAPAKPEDEFERLFAKAAKKPAEIKRGKFGRYAHDKVFIVSDANGPRQVLTGSTNFSVTGLYVNSNHVLVFDNAAVAKKYAEVFTTAWDGDVKTAAFSKSGVATTTFALAPSASLPRMEVTFSPHAQAFASQVLQGVADRVTKEGMTAGGSVLFAVMELDSGTGPIFPALRALHADQEIFSYGISDSPGGIRLYEPGKKTGVLVTGKPVRTVLPPPFDQVPGVGLGHQVHHKFVVCGFNGNDPVVYCGSSNLALTGETVNGDNLLAIHDKDVATAFAIEALALVDHFEFLDRSSAGDKTATAKPPPASKTRAAVDAGWFLSTTDKWVDPYFDPNDLKCVDRLLFA